MVAGAVAVEEEVEDDGGVGGALVVVGVADVAFDADGTGAALMPAGDADARGG